MTKRDIPYANERWYKLLLVEIEASSVQAVANRLGIVRRARLSQIKNGLMLNASTENVAKRVMELFDRFQCPYLNAEITGEDCRETWSGPTPTHDPAKLAQRRICRTCAHNQQGGAANG